MHPSEAVLNDFADGALGASDRIEVERHLSACGECRRLVDDFRELRRRAASLDLLQPPARVWQRIERDLGSARLQPSGRLQPTAGRSAKASRYVFGLAAAAVLVLATILVVRFASTNRSAPAPTASAPDAQAIASELALAEEHYQKAISGLEQIANAEKGSLDPQTAATLQKNLSVIDQAISESRAALKAQPTSEPAQQSLLESFKSKIALLQDTVALINETRKGNDAGAARIVSGLKQKS
jgi:anti-sigma-K factor RskA